MSAEKEFRQRQEVTNLKGNEQSIPENEILADRDRGGKMLQLKKIDRGPIDGELSSRTVRWRGEGCWEIERDAGFGSHWNPLRARKEMAVQGNSLSRWGPLICSRLGGCRLRKGGKGAVVTESGRSKESRSLGKRQ